MGLEDAVVRVVTSDRRVGSLLQSCSATRGSSEVTTRATALLWEHQEWKKVLFISRTIPAVPEVGALAGIITIRPAKFCKKVAFPVFITMDNNSK
jgi:hypothetical protein